MKHIDVEQELELAHNEYLQVKKVTLYNLRSVKQCYNKLLKEERINKETYKALIAITNNTIKFIKMREI